MRARRSFLFAALLAAAACEGDPTGDVQAEKDRGAAFLEAAAKENGAIATPSGLVFRTLTPGHGDSPKAADTVKVHYTGKLIDGTTFDSSVNRGAATFPLTRVIACWTEGLQRMHVGETALLGCPSVLAYADRGHPGSIPGGATLMFEVELLEIQLAPATPRPIE